MAPLDRRGARGSVRLSAWVVVLALSLVACSRDEAAPRRLQHRLTVAPPEPSSEVLEACDDPVVVYRDGAEAGSVCPANAARRGLTVIELEDAWVPRLLRGGEAHGPVPYAGRYRALAASRFGPEPEWDRARRDRFFEVHGIPPTLHLAAARLRETARHRCHAAIDDEPLEALDEALDTWRPLAEQRGDPARVVALERQLAAVRRSLGKSPEELAEHPRYGAWMTLRDRLLRRAPAVAAMQAHLRCEGILGPEEGRIGLLDSATIGAMFAFHRRHMLVSWQLDPATRDLLVADPRELDFLVLLRALRERVVDAAGLLADGTAGAERARVVGRVLDTPVYLAPEEPTADAAPDLVGRATDAAARALGWTRPAAALAFFEEPPPSRVAVRLPPAPPWAIPHAELRAAIDRGDVWTAPPPIVGADRRLQPVERRPTLTLWAKHEGREIALVRWPTTIGGWQPERAPSGRVKLAYQESPPGPRIWRDVVAAPRWVPPRSTPHRELVRPVVGGGWRLHREVLGPGYASAYGLVMMVHHRVDRPPRGEPFLTDQGIRTHGSSKYDSILDGYSHGCHRLHNHRAVRLAGFLLAHRRHVVHGPIPFDFVRDFHWRGSRMRLDFESRGYRYELTPPVEVEVTEGRLLGRR